MTVDIKNFNSTMTGAPVLSGTAGSMIAVLDAVLVDGFGAQVASSVVVTSGLAVVTLPNTPSAQVGTVVAVTGATPAGLNGEHIVTATSANTLSFATAEADGAASGVIAVKTASMGWAKPWSGTNTAAYQSPDPTSTGCLLYVNDTTTTSCRVRGFESMTDINTGTGPFPTDALLSGGGYWPKSSTASAVARAWFIVGDARLFYVWIAPGAATPNNGQVFAFGDFVSQRSSDPYACMLSTGFSGGEASATKATGCVGHGGEAAPLYTFFARSYTGIGGAVSALKRGSLNTGAAYSGASGYNADALIYPNPSDNGLTVAPISLIQNNALRGTLPGALHTPLLPGGQFFTKDTVSGTDSFAGRTLAALRCGTATDAANYGTLFVDLTGPWRT